MGDVLQINVKAPKLSARQWADVWQGILAMMEHNRRTSVEIGIDDVRRILAMSEREASR